MKKLLVLILSIPLSFSILSAQTNPSAWSNEIPASGDPNPRHEAGYVAVGEKFYLLGGRGIKAVNIYDPKNKTWSNGEAPPMQLHHFQPVAYEGKIYCIGAMTGNYPSETGIANIMIYDPGADDWSTGASIPQNRRRGGAGLVVHDDKFYLVSGIVDGHRSGHVTWMDRYDPKTNQWEILKDAPRARDHFQASLVDGKIYAVGGRRSMAGNNVFAHTVAEVDVYDIATDTWTTLSNDIPTERAGCYNAVVGKEIIVIGGESDKQETAHDEVEALDTETGEWRSLPSLIRGRHGSGATWYDNALYTVSGSGNRGGSPELESQEKLEFEQTTTPIDPNQGGNSFKIFPNPTKDPYINIDYQGNLKNLTVEIFDLKGSLVSKATDLNEFPMRMDLVEENLQGSVYIVNIHNEEKKFSTKILFQQ